MSLPDDVRYGGFWRRLAAWTLDTVLLFVVLLCVAVFHGIIFGLLGALLDRSSGDVEEVANGVGLGVALVITWLYFAVLESSEWQATVGKRAFGMMVTNLAGGRIGFWRATLRHACKVLSGAIFGTGFVMIASTPQKQALHDGLAKTLVIMRRALGPSTAVEQADAADEARA